MHISYEHDVDALFMGSRAALREHIVRELDVWEENGTFSVRTKPTELAEAVFRLGQALTRIYEVALSRERPSAEISPDHGQDPSRRIAQSWT